MGRPRIVLTDDDGVLLSDEVIVSPPFTCGNRPLLTCPPRRAPSHYESGRRRSHNTASRRGHPRRAPAARRGGRAPDLSSRAGGTQTRRLAGRGLRRGGQGAACRSGCRGGGHSRSQARAARPRSIPKSWMRRRERSSMPRFAPAPRSRWRSRRPRASIATTSCGRRYGRLRARSRRCRSSPSSCSSTAVTASSVDAIARPLSAATPSSPRSRPPRSSPRSRATG